MPPRLPGGYICYNTNIIQATNEFLKSTIKGETNPAAATVLALASFAATYTSNIPGCCCASITFSIKSDISSKLNPGVETRTKKTKEGKRLENSHVQFWVRLHSREHLGLYVCVPPAPNRLHHRRAPLSVAIIATSKQLHVSAHSPELLTPTANHLSAMCKHRGFLCHIGRCRRHNGCN